MKYPMYVDFAITPYCNLHCSFCYAEANGKTKSQRKLLSLEEIESIFSEFDQLGVMRVGFEGVEPFFRDDWYEIFKLADQHYFNYFVNTNGTLIDEDTAKKLKNTNIDKVCVSLDGSDSRIHDKSRGKIGTFDLTIRGINNLVKEEIFVDGIITLTKYNQEDIFNIINLMTELGVSEIAIMLLSTVGSAGKSKDSCYLSYEELKKVVIGLTDLKKFNKVKLPLSMVPVGEGEVPWEIYLPLKEEGRLNDLHFWVGNQHDTLGENAFGCTAGKDNFFVNAYGEIYGCSMMGANNAFKAGDIRKNTLKEIWKTSKVFETMRKLDIRNLEGKCKTCKELSVCMAGCRACAYEATGNFSGSDLRCPIEVIV